MAVTAVFMWKGRIEDRFVNRKTFHKEIGLTTRLHKIHIVVKIDKLLGKSLYSVEVYLDCRGVEHGEKLLGNKILVIYDVELGI